ncbi:hypothetical protein EX30DRAFT_337429 [Ascodesmis nigricans]|uniref:Uncharacterized protein n=1 Tax=Ascodesmis nigricans TaxID=341454 RepID=A0A4S2N6N9_9PEZI|nr:hypothetical protein EX30DRAFT_337429 [Ascodesmis nigricans]
MSSISSVLTCRRSSSAPSPIASPAAPSSPIAKNSPGVSTGAYSLSTISNLTTQSLSPKPLSPPRCTAIIPLPLSTRPPTPGAFPSEAATAATVITNIITTNTAMCCTPSHILSLLRPPNLLVIGHRGVGSSSAGNDMRGVVVFRRVFVIIIN